jgi:hypothetical protein
LVVAAPIRALIVPNGCSTVSRRWRIVSGCPSSRRATTAMATLDEVFGIFGAQRVPLSSNEAA